ncbi:membrane protein insertase YidC [Hyphobacterium sp. CCMP332]|uniref:membrane protein insertase YidC n=1 Tax=Hyphobacterium sp. CCMP332 TaxID=2749086 RepID=UPI001650B9BF|nr:membrane protein insertase YidC [Hyphobacterium sp. CCMP332]QNL19422.1 membrane protein insertase YidC [Hyphobacterium sp. CCMP332]
MGDNRNIILAIVISAAILIPYQIFVLGPMNERQQAARLAEQSTAVQTELTGLAANANAAAPDGSGPAEEQRIEIVSEAVTGSLSLTGTRIDELRLQRYDTEVDDDTPVEFLRRRDGANAFYAQDGWQGLGSGPTDAPGFNANWTLVSGNQLTPETPVVLEYRGSDGLVFRRTISLDNDYMFTFADEIENTSGQTASLSRFARVRRDGEPPAPWSPFFILHEGPIGVVGTTILDEKYRSMNPGDETDRSGTGGWMGITDKYWMAAVIPDQSMEFEGSMRLIGRQGEDTFQSGYVTQPVDLAPGATLATTARIFAGAKRVDLLQAYEEDLGISRFDMAVDWGMFWFLTRPYFWLLHTLSGFLGGIGFAILAVTVLVKILFFPLANRAYVSMAKMKNLQPKMQELREKYADDKQKQQQETIALYQREKVNPLAGCLPILFQIPVFYALYKTLFVTLEMRHEPFPGWIQDLAAPDPTSLWNLFGLLPYDPSGLPLIGTTLAIGAWPILMGITMWAQQSLNPPPPDKMQARIFAFLPLVFTFILANFAVGLVIYWAWNNFLSVVQQYIIMRRQGVETQLDKLVKRLANRGGEAS